MPLAWCLDLMLDEDVGTVHSKREMMNYVKVHLKRGELDKESGNVMRGALEMKEKRVHEVMTPLEDVYMLPESTRLSFKVVREIFEQGFSRARAGAVSVARTKRRAPRLPRPYEGLRDARRGFYDRKRRASRLPRP